MSDLQRAIGARLSLLRCARGMSQAQVGVALGRFIEGPALRTRQAVSAAEKGHRAFTAAELVAYAALFEVTVDSLVAQPQCTVCMDAPPPGFTCQACGTG
jgi:transcriptional regulator with XRE-family HTH domain